MGGKELSKRDEQASEREGKEMDEEVSKKICKVVSR